MKSLYENRWRAAVALADEINRLVSQKGFIVLMDNEPFSRFTITETEIYEQCDNCRVIWFENNLDFDHGLYTPIKKWRDELLSRLIIAKPIRVRIPKVKA